MEVIYGIENWRGSQPACVAVGTFDGVHRGHQALLRGAVAAAHAQQAVAVALTFDPHPLAVLAPDRVPLLLGTLEDRLALFAAAGIDRALVMRFDRHLAQTSAEDFARGVLAERLQARAVFVGYNFRFGRGGAGTPEDLERWGSRWGFWTHVVPPVRVGNQVVSSSRVRALLEAGQVEAAAEALGRLYSVAGRVVRGEGRGAGLGFPTANLELAANLVLPAPGVYAVWVRHGDALRPGVANLGRRPTFGGGELRLEVHLLDGAADLYGQVLRVGFARRLREERRFAGPEELVSQIRRDVEAARDALGQPPVADPLLVPPGQAGSGTPG
ncbi:FMN adenylyltransferase; riboflavin kinase [Thermaerobacter marianensis DSM 12885]|uniref:Riboflavin biosynthesis protein n=1 Tax=Thermaerobacter marianensis (strain ATCC 700841 / DSM 12885 / JCM 10246 / 7p75a) TaxID=644966 RepID=E6SJS4_THEM7|nr:bifunctional riboflavin kinase/FAD synthetase [Thermaerobacter marianensis]ADU51137.1 FMN adenylyltransferase; riboflavin kinase [Thermaerobacter marianensis DSM 12885]